MSKLAIAGAVLLALTAPLPLPAFAQAAVGEPGMAAFYHPDADILRSGMSGHSYGAPPAYAPPPYDAQASVGGGVVEQTYRPQRASRSARHRSRVSPY